MSISHDATRITIGSTETGDTVRAYITANSLGSVVGRSTVMSRSIGCANGATFTDHDCTWIFPSTWHWDFNNTTASLFEIIDGVIVYTEGAKGHSTQLRANTLRLKNVQFRVEAKTGRTDFFSAGDSGFEFDNVQFISYGGYNYLHLPTKGGLLENVVIRVGDHTDFSNVLIVQPDCNPSEELTVKNMKLDVRVGQLVGNGNGDLTAVTRFVDLDWGATLWRIGDYERGQYYKVINPIKPTGWTGYKGSSDLTSTRVDEFHTYNARIVDGSASGIENFIVQLRRQDGTLVVDSMTDSVGDISEHEVMTVEQFGETSFTTYPDFNLSGYKYGFTPLTGVKSLQDGAIDETQLSILDSGITEQNKSTVEGYYYIDSSDDLYDFACSYFEDNFAGETEFYITKTGDVVDLGSRDIFLNLNASDTFAIDATSVTIRTSGFVGSIKTTGKITFKSASIGDGCYFDGTVALDQQQNITNATMTKSFECNIPYDGYMLLTDVSISQSIWNKNNYMLTIEKLGASSFTAGDAGENNGDTFIKTPVTLTVNGVTSGSEPSAYARCYIEALGDSGQDPDGTVLMNKDASVSTGDGFYKADEEYNYRGAQPVLVRARFKGYLPFKASGFINSSGLTITAVWVEDSNYN